MKLEFNTETDVSLLKLDVVMDREGLDFLLCQLQFLAKQKTEHIHLFSEAWGDGDLTQATDVKNAYNKVTVYLVDEEAN